MSNVTLYCIENYANCLEDFAAWTRCAAQNIILYSKCRTTRRSGRVDIVNQTNCILSQFVLSFSFECQQFYQALQAMTCASLFNCNFNLHYFLLRAALYHIAILIVARCTTGPRRAVKDWHRKSSDRPSELNFSPMQLSRFQLIDMSKFILFHSFNF